MSDNSILSGLGEYLRRSGRNLADIPGDTYSALSGLANSVPHIPFAQAGIESYDGALTGTNLPYYGDDEIAAAREYFDRQPRSSTSRLIDLIGNAMPGAITGPKTARQLVGRAAQEAAPPPQQRMSITDELKQLRAEIEAQRGQ